VAGAGTARKFEAKQRSMIVVISSIGEQATRWSVTFKHNEKGDTRSVEASVSKGEWKTQAQDLDSHIKALTWLAHKLWAEMEARNG